MTSLKHSFHKLVFFSFILAGLGLVSSGGCKRKKKDIIVTGTGITGTGTETGTSSGTQTGTATGTLTGSGSSTFISVSPPKIITRSIDAGIVNTYYSFTFTAINGNAPYDWQITSAPPSGLSFFDNGTISGTPDKTGVFTFEVRVYGACGEFSSKEFTLNVYEQGELHFVNSTLKDGNINIPYSDFIRVAGGVPPYTWTKTDGLLPIGLGFNTSTGEIYGTPTKVYSRTFTIRVDDSKGDSISSDFLLCTITEEGIGIEQRYHLGPPKIDGIPWDGTDDRYDKVPSVIRMPDGTYKMWWHRKHPTQGRDTIHYAWSRDFIHWHDDQQVLISEMETLEEGRHAATPSVIIVDGTYYMAYETDSARVGEGDVQVMLATSEDGINWTKYPRMIPGRESEEPLPIMPFYREDLRGLNYGIGFPSLMYRDGKFILYYYDGITPIEEGKDPAIAMVRKVSTTNPLSWNTDIPTHQTIMYGASMTFAYYPVKDRVIVAFNVFAPNLVDPQPDRRGEIYITLSDDSAGEIFTPNRKTRYDHVMYKVTADDPRELTRHSPSVMRDAWGWVTDLGRPVKTITVFWTEGDMALPGEDWRSTWPTWDLRIKLVKLNIHYDDPIEFPSGMNIKSSQSFSLHHVEGGKKYPIYNDLVLAGLTHGHPERVVEIPDDILTDIPLDDRYWLEKVNYKCVGEDTIWWVEGFERYYYNGNAHYLSFYPTGDPNLVTLPGSDFNSTVALLPVKGIRQN